MLTPNHVDGIARSLAVLMVLLVDSGWERNEAESFLKDFASTMDEVSQSKGLVTLENRSLN